MYDLNELTGTTAIMLLGITLTLAFIGGVVLLFWSLIRKAVQRTKALKEFAISKGLGFQEEEDAEKLRQLFQCLPTFQKGNKFKLVNMMIGSLDGVSVLIGDYTYWTIYGTTRKSSSEQVRQTVLCFELKGVDLPPFDITINSNLFSHTAFNAKEALNCRSDERFAQRYIVCAAPSSGRSGVESIVSKDIQVAMGKLEGLRMEVCGYKMMFTRHNLPIKTQAMEEHFNCALEVASLLAGAKSQN